MGLRPRRWARGLDPHVTLGLAAGLSLLVEIARHEASGTGYPFAIVEACIAAAALVLVSAAPERIRLGPLLAITLAFHAGWVGIELGLFDFTGHTDSLRVYRTEGNALLHGHYPRSEYPPGAVLLFAVEAWLGGGKTLVSNALVMIPFQLATVAATWLLRSRYSSWFAALLAIWPANAFVWTFRFDLVPTALFAVGLLLAWRERWTLAGAALGLGATVKWTPGLSALVIAVWLFSSRRWAAGARHAAAWAVVVLVVHLPFLIWAPSELEAAYRRQGGRGITAESIYYLPLRAFGLAHLPAHIWEDAGAPHWTKAAAVAVQAVVVGAIVAVAVWRRNRTASALSLAALAPVAFLLTNRIFSPQFLIPIFTGLAVSASLVGLRTRGEMVWVGALAALAALAGALVFPWTVPSRPLAMAALTGSALIATLWLIARAAGAGRAGEPV